MTDEEATRAILGQLEVKGFRARIDLMASEREIKAAARALWMVLPHSTSVRQSDFLPAARAALAAAAQTRADEPAVAGVMTLAEQIERVALALERGERAPQSAGRALRSIARRVSDIERYGLPDDGPAQYIPPSGGAEGDGA